MAELFENLASLFRGGQATAVQSTPMNFRDMLGPLLQQVQREMADRADPVQRLYDLGSAGFDSSSTGTPFARNLAAGDARRDQAMRGAAGMLFNVLGQERQLEELKAQERRHAESIGIQREGMKEGARRFDVTSGQAERRIAEDRRRTDILYDRAETERIKAGLEPHKNVLKAAEGTLSGEGKLALRQTLGRDADYQAAKRRGDVATMDDIAAKRAIELGKTPKYLAGPGTSASVTEDRFFADQSGKLFDHKVMPDGSVNILNPRDRAIASFVAQRAKELYTQSQGKMDRQAAINRAYQEGTRRTPTYPPTMKKADGTEAPDPNKMIPGAYYTNKQGAMFRWDGKKLIREGEPGFELD